MAKKPQIGLEYDRLRKRHGDLGDAIDELMDSISKSSSSTEALLMAELAKARKEVATIAKRLKDMAGEDE